MKRIIASRDYTKESFRHFGEISSIAADIADICNASDIDTVNEIAHEAGFRGINDVDDIVEVKAEIINRAVEYLVRLKDNLIDAVNKRAAEPAVKNNLITFLSSEGYMMKLTTCSWSNDAYVLMPPGTFEFDDLNRTCKKIQDRFGFKRWDTPLSGSWTGHSASIDGITFHVSIEREKGNDKSSLLLYF